MLHVKFKIQLLHIIPFVHRYSGSGSVAVKHGEERVDERRDDC